MFIQKQDCKMDVDVDKTIEYYREHSPLRLPRLPKFLQISGNGFTKAQRIPFRVWCRYFTSRRIRI